MTVFYKIVSLLGGLALFLYGMRIMGDGLKSSSGGAMKAALEKVTNKPVMGFILGLVVTCMIQSSTATIVLTVGLVGAGFLTFRQSIGIVLGANVGTSITAQIIRLMDIQAGATSILYFFKSDNLAPMALIIGIILIMFIGSRTSKSIGTICMGFGILFVGLMNMSSAVSTMSDSLSKLLVSFQTNYFLGFLAGVLTTGVIQSSSAVVGILQSIASSVGVTFSAIFTIIIGVNIGDCVTTFLVCGIGAKTEQLRTCLVHIIYNIFSAALIIIVITVLRVTGILNDSIWYMRLGAGGVANVHGLFRLVPALCLLPLTDLFAGIAEKIVKEEKNPVEDAEIEENLRQLDERLIDNPTVALNEAEHLIAHMGEVAKHNVQATSQQLFAYDVRRADRIQQREDLLDRMADASNKYLVAVSPHITLESDERNQSFQLKALVCFERIGDLAVNIAENIQDILDNDLDLSKIAKKEIITAYVAIDEILDLTIRAYTENDISLAIGVEPIEETIDDLLAEIESRHIQRMVRGECTSLSGIRFQDILQNMERISDKCSDLAVYLLARRDDRINGAEHQYLHNLHHSNSASYQNAFREAHDKYFGMLEESDAAEETETSVQ